MTRAPAIALQLQIQIRSHVPLDRAARREVRTRLERKLARYASQLRAVSVSFDDLNGPRGGVDTRCRICAGVQGRPGFVATATAADARAALVRAVDVLERTVRRALQRAGRSTRARRGQERTPSGLTAARTSLRGDAGSLIGRRVGRSRENLERVLARPEKIRRDVYVDTAAPGTSASHRKAGYGATAARNTKRNTAGMTSTLEDSRTRPSRKSTRRSSNRSKAATAITRREMLRAGAPRARAAKARARRPRRG